MFKSSLLLRFHLEKWKSVGSNLGLSDPRSAPLSPRQFISPSTSPDAGCGPSLGDLGAQEQKRKARRKGGKLGWRGERAGGRCSLIMKKSFDLFMFVQ